MSLSESSVGVGTEQAVGADLDEAAGQDVLEEAPDEILRTKPDALDLLGAIVPITEGDLGLFEAFDPAVGDGDAKDIPAEVLQDLLAVAGVLAVDDPVLLPDGGWDLIEPAPFLESGAEFAAKDFAQGKAGNQEDGMAGLNPLLALAGKSAGADQQMDVGMIKQGPGAGVQDGQHRQSSAHIAGIPGQLL